MRPSSDGHSDAGRTTLGRMPSPRQARDVCRVALRTSRSHLAVRHGATSQCVLEPRQQYMRVTKRTSVVVPRRNARRSRPATRDEAGGVGAVETSRSGPGQSKDDEAVGGGRWALWAACEAGGAQSVAGGAQ